MDIMIEEFKNLISKELYTSAEILGDFIICNSAGRTYETYSSFGNIFLKKKEYLRALHYYRKSLEILYQTPGKLQTEINSKNDVKLKFKMSKCLVQLQEIGQAINLLEKIKPESFTFKMKLFLATQYKKKAFVKKAISKYEEVLKECPFALEALIELINLAHINTKWIITLIDAHSLQRNQNFNGALEAYNSFSVSQNDNQNLYVLSGIAVCYVELALYEKAVEIFEKIKRVDKYLVKNMDMYGAVLKDQGNSLQLNRLSHELVQCASHKPECWTTVALYCEIKRKKDKSLEYLDKALSINPDHHVAVLLKGFILLNLGLVDQALECFKKGYELHPNLTAAQGLVRSHVVLENMQEALDVAESMCQRMPNSPKSLSLKGLVLSHQVESKNEARALFGEALKLDPHCVDTVLGLSQLNIMEGKYEESINLLKEQLEFTNKDFINTKLGEVYTLNGDYNEAFEYYNAALTINPNCDLAIRALERLEAMMKGIDPDELDEFGSQEYLDEQDLESLEEDDLEDIL